MIISTKKTKEMLIGSILKNPPSLLQLNGQLIERVKSYKLLGLHVTDSLQWKVHVSSMCSRAAQRLHFLQQLKRAAMSSDDLLYYYQSVVRPVIEYACVRMAHKFNARTDQTPRIHSEACDENYLRQRQ